MIKYLPLLLLLIIPITPSHAGNLKNQPSPYLQLHAKDAVAWQSWDETILKQAQEQNKLIFISVGYFSCHWCHVMRDESFNDEDIAKQLNGDFIPVKVDRELDPALDSYLIEFVQRTRGYAGWPLNVLVTPEGYPLLGMVYVPKPSLGKLLTSISQRWQQDSKKLRSMALAAFEEMSSSGKSVSMMPGSELRALFRMQLNMHADEMQGGVASMSPSRFPREPLLLALLDFYQQQPDEDLKEFIQLTLNQISSHGLHDVIAGGFFRYTVDPGWQVPHFEKMLYTNAGLLQVFVKAHEIFGDQSYLDIAVETTTFLLREMRAENGGFISALSALDASGREGGSYLWQKKEMRALLSHEQWQKIEQNWQFYSNEHITGELPAGLAVAEEWDQIRQRLSKKHVSNPAERDDKVLPGWNGYMLSALTAVVRATGDKSFQRAGDKLYQLLLQQAKQGLKRGSGKESQRFLEDYAFVAQGLQDWSELHRRDLPDDIVKQLVNDAVKLFSTDAGWYLSDSQWLPLPSQLINLSDSQLPAADVVIMKLFEKLDYSDNLELKKRLQGLSQRAAPSLTMDALSYASQIIYQLNKLK